MAKKDNNPIKKYRVLWETPIHVNGKPRQLGEIFEEDSTREEMLPLTVNKYVEVVKEA